MLLRAILLITAVLSSISTQSYANQQHHDGSISGQFHLHSAHRQPTVLAMSACNLGAALQQGNSTKSFIKEELAFKSLLRNVRCGLHLYILVSSAEDAVTVSAWFGKLSSPWQPVSYTFLFIQDAAVRTRLEQIKGPLEGYMGMCGFARLFFTDFLASEERVVWLDTDMIINADVCELWSHFDRFTESNIIGLPGDQTVLNHHDWHGLCSCVALLHLGKMRALGWSPDYVAAAITMHRARVNPEEAFPFGDQDVFRIVHELYPGSVYKVPSSWDLMPFCGGYDVAAHEQQAGAFPGIVHFTCTNKAQIYSSLESFGRWGWLVQYYQAMQWEWLNEGRLEQRMHATAPMEIK